MKHLIGDEIKTLQKQKQAATVVDLIASADAFGYFVLSFWCGCYAPSMPSSHAKKPSDAAAAILKQEVNVSALH